MNMAINENYYFTSDFCLAVTLITQGFPIIGLDRTNSKRIQFFFDDTRGLQKTLACYWERKILISPQDFYANQRLLKSQMYSGE